LLPDISKCTVTAVRGERCGNKSICVPFQSSTSVCLLGVPIDRHRRDDLFEPIQLRYELIDLLLDIFGMLGTSVSTVHDKRPLDAYLIMLDDRAHTAQGGLEGGEPIGGLFRNIDENLYTICNPLPLY